MIQFKRNLILIFIFFERGFSSKSGWVQLESGCYQFGQNAVTWDEAKQFCGSQGGKLVEIETTEENSAIGAEILKQRISSKQLLFWTGLVGLDRRRPKNWVFDSTKEKPAWTEFHPGQGETEEENCAFLWAFSAPEVPFGSWHDINCGSKGFFFANRIHLSITALCERQSCPSSVPTTRWNSTDGQAVKDETVVVCSLVISLTLIISTAIIVLTICLRKRSAPPNIETAVVDKNPMYGQYYNTCGERLGSAQVRDQNSGYGGAGGFPTKIRDNNSRYPVRNEATSLM